MLGKTILISSHAKSRRPLRERTAAAQDRRTVQRRGRSANRSAPAPNSGRAPLEALRRSGGKIIGLAGINRDITERKQWEARLNLASPVGGRVLAGGHGRGGHIQSCTTWATCSTASTSQPASWRIGSRIAADNLERVALLFREHQYDLAHFLTQEEKGRHLVQYVESFWNRLAGHRKTSVLAELACLVRNIGTHQGDCDHATIARSEGRCA